MWSGAPAGLPGLFPPNHHPFSLQTGARTYTCIWEVERLQVACLHGWWRGGKSLKSPDNSGLAPRAVCAGERLGIWQEPGEMLLAEKLCALLIH